MTDLALPDQAEHGFWHAHAAVNKWRPATVAQVLGDLGLVAPSGDELLAITGAPDDTADADGNILCTAGVTRMLTLLIAGGGQGLDNTHSRLGTGDSSTAATAADTDLGASAGSTHRWFQVADATFPSVATNVVTIKATFGTADGNYTAGWLEWGWDAGTASGNTVTAPLINHKIASLGTKVSGAVWQLAVTLTVS